MTDPIRDYNIQYRRAISAAAKRQPLTPALLIWAHLVASTITHRDCRWALIESTQEAAR